MDEWKPTHVSTRGGSFKVLKIAWSPELICDVVVFEDVNGDWYTRPKDAFDECYKPIPEQLNGANGMKAGDRIIHEPTGRRGVAREFLQDGDVTVLFDNGERDMVKWAHCVREEKQSPAAALREYRQALHNLAAECDASVVADIQASLALMDARAGFLEQRDRADKAFANGVREGLRRGALIASTFAEPHADIAMRIKNLIHKVKDNELPRMSGEGTDPDI